MNYNSHYFFKGIALFEIIFYGEIEKFLDSIEVQSRAKTLSILELLSENGNLLGMPHSKSLNNGLFELRIKSKQNIRIFYIFTKYKKIYLLHGFIKTSQKTPKKELEKAFTLKERVENENF